MAKSTSVVSLIYAYVVCLVAIVAGLISVSTAINAAFDLYAPLKGNGYYYNGYDVSTFDNYKASQDWGVSSAEPAIAPADPAMPAPDGTVRPAPTEEELRARYEAARQERIEGVRYDAFRSLTISGMVIVLSAVLFVIHWRFAQQLNRQD